MSTVILASDTGSGWSRTVGASCRPRTRGLGPSSSARAPQLAADASTPARGRWRRRCHFRADGLCLSATGDGLRSTRDCRGSIVESSADSLRGQFRVVHGLFDTWPESSSTTVAAARYAEGVVVEDMTVNIMVGGSRPLALSTWRGRTGLSRLPPLGRCWSQRTWADDVKIDVAELRTYAHAVYAATDAYLSEFRPAPDRLTRRVLSALLLSLSARHPLRVGAERGALPPADVARDATAAGGPSPAANTSRPDAPRSSREWPTRA